MDVRVKYVVCGISEDGFGWHSGFSYQTPEEAEVEMERWARYDTEVWVEKHTTHIEIVKSISGPTLPDPALIPA
jgi:hypothetical protein